MTISTAIRTLWREPAGALLNSLAIGYAAFGRIAGFMLMASTSVWLNIAGVFLSAHAMLIAAYLIHESAHYTLFAQPNVNRGIGEVMSFVAGSCYASFERIRHMHLRNHRDRLKRTLDDGYGVVGVGKNPMANFSGAHGVSFLTVV
jgi:fatty acid desaturase